MGKEKWGEAEEANCSSEPDARAKDEQVVGKELYAVVR
jgi:hypothetical protein